jgi:hypothetical protein
MAKSQTYASVFILGFSTVCTMLECNPETLRFIINGLSQTIGYDIRAGEQIYFLVLIFFKNSNFG